MPSTVTRIYLSTRKKNDQLFNTYVMRPLASVVVAIMAPTGITPNQVTLANLAVFLVAALVLALVPTTTGALAAIATLEASYLLDCADGMLARYKQLASKQGALFDFFVDESKAVLLVGALGIRLWRAGGFGGDGRAWPSGDARFLLAAIVGVAIVASAISLTNFVRRPELSGRETQVDAFYESAPAPPMAPSALARAVRAVMTFLRFLNHYPSHIWLFALAGRLDAFFWLYIALNALYLAQGWLGLVRRFGRATT